MREIKTKFEKQRDRAIRQIKKNIEWFRANHYTIEVEPTETMIGTVEEHIYIRHRGIKTIFEQKYLFSLDKPKEMIK